MVKDPEPLQHPPIGEAVKGVGPLQGAPHLKTFGTLPTSVSARSVEELPPPPLPHGVHTYEVRFHGRGGQGTVVASVLLAEAAFLEHRGVQAYPFFGVERRGAPVVAYTRVGGPGLRLSCTVEHPSALVVMDPSLLRGLRGTWEKGLLPHGDILVNAAKLPRGAVKATPRQRVGHIDAAEIALRHGLGSPANPLVNTSVLGAFAKFTGLVGLDSLEAAIRSRVPAQVEENLAAAREAYARMEGP